MVPVALTRRHGPIQVTGQRTACAQLLVVPELTDDDQFSGGFLLVHQPTGLFLNLVPSGHDPAMLTLIAAGLAHLDWTSTDVADYRAARTVHAQAWRDAVAAAERHFGEGEGG